MTQYELFEKELLAEIEKREDELHILKTFPMRKNLSKKQQMITVKYAIPNIYAIWEFSIPIRQPMIDDCANHVVELMNELMFKVLEGYQKGTFKK